MPIRSTFFAAACVGLFAGHVNAQVHAWSFGLGGSNEDNAHAVAVDDFGHVYLSARILNATVDMDPGAGTASTSVAGSVIASYTSDGAYRWSWAFDGGGFETAQLATGPDGSVVLAGYLGGVGDLDPGPDLVSPFASGTGLLMVVKYDSTGAYQWSFRFGGTSYEHLSDVAVDGSGNVYICGIAYTGADFDPGPEVAIPLPEDGMRANFIAKYDPNGNHLWSRMMPGQAHWFPPKLDVDPLGNAYITGSVGDSLNMDPGGTNFRLTSWAPFEDVYLARYRSDGSFHWAGRISGPQDGYAHAIATNPQGRVVVGGTFRGSYEFAIGAGSGSLSATSSGAYDAFVATYDSLGVLQWAKRFGHGGFDRTTALDMDAQGDVVFAGYFAGAITFTNLITGYGWDDVFLGGITAQGTLLWGVGMGSNDYDRAVDMALGADGSIFLTGQYANTIDLDPGGGVAAHTAVGQYDLFLARYDGITTGVSASTVSGLRLAPNPARDRLVIDNTDLNGPVQLAVLDLGGRLLFTQQAASTPVVLDLQSLLPGAYVLRVQGRDRTDHLRFVKE